MSNFIYTILTSLIIILSKLRERICDPHILRIDRPIPWCEDYGRGVIFMGCCDCGLAHFVISDHSLTAVRTGKYSYRLRFGANTWTEPKPELGGTVLKKAKEAGIIS